MPIAIVLRRNITPNLFRNVILSAVSSGIADEVLMCSGYFQEGHSSFYATLEGSKKVNGNTVGGFAQECAKNNIKLTTVGVKSYKNNKNNKNNKSLNWIVEYKRFQANLKKANVKNAQCFYKKGGNWHGKVFIALYKGQPLLGIIGSSNITRSAFSTHSPFNQECDVILWPEGASYDSVITDALGESDFENVIRAPYLPDQNGNITVEERLRDLYDEILEPNGLENLEDI